MPSKLKKGVFGVCMIVIALLSSGCVATGGTIDSFCLWAKPITITDHELKMLSMETLRELDDFNQEWQIRCG